MAYEMVMFKFRKTPLYFLFSGLKNYLFTVTLAVTLKNVRSKESAFVIFCTVSSLFMYTKVPHHPQEVCKLSSPLLNLQPAHFSCDRASVYWLYGFNISTPGSTVFQSDRPDHRINTL